MSARDPPGEGSAGGGIGTMIAAIELKGGAATPRHFGGSPGVTKRIARITRKLVRNHLSLDVPLFPSGISRATACASMSEGR
jgi:hypothetical protein